MTTFTLPDGIDPFLDLEQRVRLAFERIAEVDRPEVWIALRTEDEVLADAHTLRVRHDAGEPLPLYGVLVAVKDNIDVVGLATTAGCPEFTRDPSTTAPVVARLIAGGALVLGKTNLDQFATGLVGTRSPYGAVRCAWDPQRISGGSSSGSATAVALGIVDIALGTDTAGSGRVPAAFNGIVGIKPTLGLVPNTGVVPACVDYDAVTVFARDLSLAARAMSIMIGPDKGDPRSRVWPPNVALSASETPRVAIPRAEDLNQLSPAFAEAFERTIDKLTARGIEHEIIDISALLDAAQLLYDGAIVAQRYAAVGQFLETDPAGSDPIVAAIILAAKTPAAHSYVDDLGLLASTKAAAHGLLNGFDALLLPTTTEHPSLAAVEAEPLSINRRLGTFTNFCNLLDMAAVAVPGELTTDGDPFGVMVVVPAFDDQIAIDIAARLTDQPSTLIIEGGIDVFIVGAHLRGLPLHSQLIERGARFLGETETSNAYRLIDLNTTPPKPGLVRHAPGEGSPIAGELYQLSPAHLGTLLSTLPEPMGMARIELADGRTVVGFNCSFEAASNCTDITQYGGWLRYLATLGA